MRWWQKMHRLLTRHDAETLARVMDQAETHAIEQRQMTRLARREAMDRLFQAALEPAQQGENRP